MKLFSRKKQFTRKSAQDGSLNKRRWLSDKSGDPWLWMGAMVFVLLALLFHLSTSLRWGVAVKDDSVYYLVAAKNFLQGKGLSWISGDQYSPLTHYPPLYSLSLSVLGFLLRDVDQAATYLASFFFAGNILLVVMLVYFATKETFFALAGGAILLLSPVFLEVHLQAMSEPLYIACTLLGLFLIAAHIRNQERQRLILAAFVAALAFLTRYIGLSVIITGVIAILFWQQGSLKRKFSATFLYGAIAVFPNMIWYVRNYILTGSFTNRVLVFHPIAKEKAVEAGVSIASWLLPVSVPLHLRALLMAAIVFATLMGIAILWRSKGRRVPASSLGWKFLAILFLYALIYSLMLLLSLTFFDASTRLSNRILSPLYTIGMILVVIILSYFLDRWMGASRGKKYLVATVLFAAVSAVYLARSLQLTNQFRLHGDGYTGEFWRNSSVISKIQQMDSEMVLYSNEAFALYYITGNLAYWVPERFDPVKAEERDDFDQLLKDMHETLRRQKSAVVMFRTDYYIPAVPSSGETTQRLVALYQAEEGIICVDPRTLDLWTNYDRRNLEECP